MKIKNPVRKLSEIKSVNVATDTQKLSIAVVEVLDAPAHFHKKMTEFYYILEGEGEVELNGKAYNVGPNSVVLIEPGVNNITSLR